MNSSGTANLECDPLFLMNRSPKPWNVAVHQQHLVAMCVLTVIKPGLTMSLEEIATDKHEKHTLVTCESRHACLEFSVSVCKPGSLLSASAVVQHLAGLLPAETALCLQAWALAARIVAPCAMAYRADCR